MMPSLNFKMFYFCLNITSGGSKGERGRPHRVQILSISYSFIQEIWQNRMLAPPLPPTESFCLLNIFVTEFIAIIEFAVFARPRFNDNHFVAVT